MNILPSLLIVDDEAEFRDLLVRRFQRKGHQVVGTASAEGALAVLDERCFDVGIFDIKMPGVDGLQLLELARKAQPDMEVLMLTGYGTIQTAIQAMKLGAYDYLTKPCNLEELEILVAKAAEKKQLVETKTVLHEAFRRNATQSRIVGESPKMGCVLEIARKVAPSGSPVLIEGESGTGKELIARALHDWSPRVQQPFVVVNAGALSGHLLESELFGHEKGAFTGAVAQKKGLVEMAHRGTLFLDEIGEMDPGLQVKLLRFLETGEFRRVGDNRLRQVEVRIVAATNRKLEAEVKEGRFREDLYYRLNVIRILVPPLRERKEDIPLLAQYFLAGSAAGRGKRLSPDAMGALEAYDFPGNVRELANLVERGCLLASGDLITAADLFGSSPGKNTPADTLKDVEREHILRVMGEVGGNKTRAAAILGISVRNLYRKLEEYGYQT
ncbi:MAG: sigma-54 dependent transcriptional regulator [Bacillota bacterium]